MCTHDACVRACVCVCVCVCVYVRTFTCSCVHHQDDEAVLAGINEEYLEDDGEQSVRVKAAAALRCSERRIYFRTDFVSEQESYSYPPSNPCNTP